MTTGRINQVAAITGRAEHGRSPDPARHMSATRAGVTALRVRWRPKGAPVSSVAHLNIFPRDANDPEDTQPKLRPSRKRPDNAVAAAPSGRSHSGAAQTTAHRFLRLHMRVAIQASHRRPPTSAGEPPPCIAAEHFLKAQAQVKPDTVSPADRTIRASRPSLLHGALRG
jgi:hypothetical protein